jgi:choline dehydrogenase-like flavoprotein
MEMDFDVIVAGSGAGGGAFAHVCAAAGKRVLVVERGRSFLGESLPLDEQSTLVDKIPYDDRTIQVNGSPERLLMGSGVGGGTLVFGAAMLRPSPADFSPGRHYGDRLERELWDWPLSYDELAADFERAERLYQLAGDELDDFAPLPRPILAPTPGPLALAPVNQQLAAANRAAGLRPFRLPLAINSNRCARCASCAGFLCPHGARRSSAQILVETSRLHSMTILENSDVLQLERSSKGRISGIVIRSRATGIAHVLRAHQYALGAGAIGSPAILLRSGFSAPHLGRNYMTHYSPVALGLFASSTGGADEFVKQLGFADFYFGTPDLAQKMGLVQSLPVPGPLLLRKSGMRRCPETVLRFVRRRVLPLAGIVEDLPDPRNRVTLKGDGAIELQHSFNAFDEERGKSLGRAMCRILRRGGAIACVSRTFPKLEHVGHQCGTLRMAHSPRHGVVDRDCRVFGTDNLYVVDGSVLPTSLGVGPSLTIVANAMRVARQALQNH